MAATSVKTAQDLVTQAKRRVTNLTPAEVAEAIESGDPLLVDLREPAERVQNGALPNDVSIVSNFV